MLDRWALHDDPAQQLAGYRALRDRMDDASADLLRPLLMRTRLREAWALRALGHQDEALAVLAVLDAPTPPIDMEDLALRRAVAQAMDLRADLWKDQSPEAHPQQSGKDASGAVIDAVVTDATLRYAEAVDALFRRFATDAVADIRAVAAQAQYDLAVHWREGLHFQRAVDAYALYLQAFAADTAPRIEASTASAYLNQGYVLMMLMGREADALPVYDALIARFANATSADMRDTLAKAAASRLTCLNRLQRQGVAVNYGDQYEDLSLAQRDAINATIERGRVLSVEGRHREAIDCYDEVLKAHVESLHPELRRQCLDAMVRKGYSLSRLAQREAALAVNDEIIARYGDDLSTTAEKDVALAMSNRAVQLDKLGRHEEELQTYDRIIERWHGSGVAYLKERVASARYCKALTIADTDLDGALALYQQVIDTCLSAPEVALRLQAAKSTVNRSVRLRNAGRYDEAVACAETLIRACGDETDKDIAAQVVKVRIGLARACAKTGQSARQIETLEALLALPANALDATLRAELAVEYRQAKPTATAIGKAAHALGSWFGKKK
jgi:tetratricopeptide (TPR) repeat protein